MYFIVIYLQHKACNRPLFAVSIPYFLPNGTVDKFFYRKLYKLASKCCVCNYTLKQLCNAAILKQNVGVESDGEWIQGNW